MTTDYDSFLSRIGTNLRQSAIRQMGAVLAQAPDIVSFAPGYPAEDAFPWKAISQIAHDLLTGADGQVLQYGPTRGFPPLRDAIVQLMAQRGVPTTEDRIVVTTGSQQGLDLVARVLVDPGDVVLLELPSYTGAISAFRSAGASLVGIDQDADGINLEVLDRTLLQQRSEGRRVKFLYVVPNFQNPTGLLVSMEKRRLLLEWASRRQVLILEDDPYRDLFFADVTREDETRPLAADDDAGWVIYLSSFSKTLAPGLRVAWISAPPKLAAKIELSKQASDLCTGALDQRIVHEACVQGLLTTHLPGLREHYRMKRDVMVAALERAFGRRLSWPTPRGGFFLWAQLPEPLTAGRLLPFAQAQGVIYVAGTAFFVNGAGQQYLRLCFSYAPPERIELGVERLAAAVASATAALENETLPA